MLKGLDAPFLRDSQFLLKDIGPKCFSVDEGLNVF